jgi:hypothetical protein
MNELRRLLEPAQRLVTPGFRLGIEEIDFSDYVVNVDLAGGIVNLDAVEVTVAEAMSRWSDNEDESDAWLAPRFHAALRLSRREAADRGIWRYLGLMVAPGYVRWRFGKPDNDGDPRNAAPLDRFVGSDIKHALARLWWNAELFRDGSDYSPVEQVFAYQDIPNNFTRAALAHHRPTSRAFLRVIGSLPAGVNRGDAANALSKAANAAATTLLVDHVAPDPSLDEAARETWIRQAQDFDARACLDSLPNGPDDGEVPSASVATMEHLLRDFLREAPLRDRGPKK